MSENRQLAGPTRRSLVHGERIDWHRHDLNQLCYPLRGALQVSTPTGTWLVPPHRAVWVPAGVPHAHRANGPTEMRSLVFAEPVNPLRLDQPTVLTVDALLREVIAALSEGRDDAGLPARGSSPTLDRRQRRNLERVALDRLCGAEELPLDLPQPVDDRLRTVTRILLEDPADPRTAAELGACAGASERTLSRLFRAETGMTFPQWRARLRLQHALALLAAGEPVTAVAMACGFSSPSAFIETFRAALGATPGQYRHEALSTGSEAGA
jgi:AraC-like DNA-binding protein